MEQGQTFRYFSKVAGSKFIFADGHEIIFAHGFFDLKEEDYQDDFFSTNKDHPHNGRKRFDVYKEELDALIKAGNPLLYIQGTQPAPLPKPRDSFGRIGADANALSEVDVAKGNAALSGVVGRETGDLNQGTVRSDPNESTVDTQLQNVILKEAPGSRVAQARAEAAARAAATTTTGSASGTQQK